MTQDSTSATVEDVTGVVGTEGRVPLQPLRNGTLTRADWVRIVIWSLPVLFMAATMYVSVDNLSQKAVVHDAHLKHLEAQDAELKSEQKVIRVNVREVCKKQDKLMDTTEKMDDKLDVQGEDLAAIKAKLKIRE